MPAHNKVRGLLPYLLPAAGLLGGCNTVVLNPSGDVASQQGQLVVISTLLMLLIIVPVIALTLLFAWRYRQSNKAATYTPEWDHSIQLELVIWAAPLVIIIALGAVTWISTHTLDPYRSLGRIDASKPLTPGVEPIDVQVVALDWKWLFIYPEQGIATVNEMAAPVDRPIRFHITSLSVMNAFYVPALAGMIYAMPGMETKLHAVINQAGVYEGLSTNISGPGFAYMRFKFHGLDNAGFDGWVKQAKAGNVTLDRKTYLELAQPSERDPVRRYGVVAPGLFDAIVNRCVEAGKACMRDIMAADARRNLGRGLAFDEGALSRSLAGAVCTAADPYGTTTLLSLRDRD